MDKKPEKKPEKDLWASVGTDAAIDAFVSERQAETDDKWKKFPKVSQWADNCVKCGLGKARQQPALEEFGDDRIYIGVRENKEGKAELYEAPDYSGRGFYPHYIDHPLFDQVAHRRYLERREVIRVTCACGHSTLFLPADASLEN